MSWTPKKLKWVLSWLFGPYLGAAIQIQKVSNDWKYLKVIMKQKFYNNNAYNTHFGGSLYSMVDPHYVLMLINILGRDYIVWDKSASIDFIKPGKGTVMAEFRVTTKIIEEIKSHTKNGEKYLPEFEVDIKNSKGELVAKVHKTLYVRLKK